MEKLIGAEDEQLLTRLFRYRFAGDVRLPEMLFASAGPEFG